MGGQCSSSAKAGTNAWPSLDALVAAQATEGFDLATGYCDLSSSSNAKLSACYATCAGNADCAAFVFENGNGNSGTPDNTNCWFKTVNKATNTCEASSGLTSDGSRLASVSNPGLSYVQIQPNSVSM